MTRSLLPVDQMVPGANLPAYVQAVSSIPILSVERERELAEDLFYNQNLQAARELVMSHLRFVVHIARSYSGYGLAEADLIQEGNVGLMKAVKRFNPEKGVRLVSFAVHWIKAEMHEFILRNWRIVKIATTKAQRKLFFNLRSAKKSLYYLEDQSADPAQILESNDWQDSSEAQLHNALSDLDERSRDILSQRWLAEKKATLHDLAAQYSVSAERIRQLEQSAMAKLRAAIAV